MKINRLLLSICVMSGTPIFGMQKNSIIIIPCDNQGRDIRFCCPYCFEKFHFKQNFFSHVSTHDEVARLGVPIPGHCPFSAIYAIAEAKQGLKKNTKCAKYRSVNN